MSKADDKNAELEAAAASGGAEGTAGPNEVRAAPAPSAAAAGPGAAALIDDDEVDPELLDLPARRRPRRHPLISVLVVVVGTFVLYEFSDNFLYFFAPRTPSDLGEAEVAAHGDKLVHNRYVTFSGTPDRKHGLKFQWMVTGNYTGLFRVLEAPTKLFVQHPRQMSTADFEYDTNYTGRLMALRRLPYDKRLRAEFSKGDLRELTLAHDFTFQEVARAKAQRRDTIKDLRVTEVTLRPESMVWVNATPQGEWLVNLDRTHYGSIEEAEARLKSFTDPLRVPLARAAEQPLKHFQFVVRLPAPQVATLQGALRGDGVYGELVRRQVSFVSPWSAIKFVGQTLVLSAGDKAPPDMYRPSTSDPLRLVREELRGGDPIDVAAGDILYISTSTPYRVAEDAFVIIAGETPAGYWFYPVIYAVVSLFILLNALLLVSQLRAHLRKRP